jgi:hypothetical protein
MRIGLKSILKRIEVMNKGLVVYLWVGTKLFLIFNDETPNTNTVTESKASN